MTSQPPDNLLFNQLLLTFKSKNIEISFHQFKLKYFPIQVRYIILLQLTILTFCFIFLLINSSENSKVYVFLPFITIYIIGIYLLNKYFQLIKVIIQITSITSMILMIEIIFFDYPDIITSFPFLLCFFTYLTTISSSFSWILQSLLTSLFCFYFFYRTNQLEDRPGIYLYMFCQTMKNYLSEKEKRLNYYDLYRENKINENFQNLIKNIIPCGLFVCSKQPKPDVKNNANSQINQFDTEKKQDGYKQVNLNFKTIQNQNKLNVGSNKDTSVQSISINPLQINFANRQCMEDLNIINSSSIPQKINQIKAANKYQSISQMPNFEKIIPIHKSKFTTTHQDLDHKKENNLNTIINDYLSSPGKDVIQNIELNHKPEETYLNVPFENGFSETRQYYFMRLQRIITLFQSYQKFLKYFDIILVNCQWDNIEACLCVLINISQKVINQRQNSLEEFQKKMMSTITHNLKTPLNGIILLLQCLMQQQSQMSEDIYSKISDIYTNSELLLCMINDVIDYTKIQQGCFKMSSQKFKIDRLLNEIKDLYNTQLQKKQLQLILDYDGLSDYTFDTDYQRLKQVLINLTGNALKFTFEGSIKIQVKDTNADPNIIEIEVTDTGNGISKHIKQSLLQQSIHDSETQNLDKKSGSGIGLNICQCLVDKLGPHSKLFIQSVEKQGTKISFYLYRNLNRKRLASFQSYNKKKVYKKQLSLKSQYISFHTNNTNFNNSIDEQQIAQINKTYLNINSHQNAGHNIMSQKEKNDSFAISIHKTQHLLSNDIPFSSIGSQFYSSDQQGRQRKISYKEQNINDDEQHQIDCLKEQSNDSCAGSDAEDENNHIASQNLKELNKYDIINSRFNGEDDIQKDNAENLFNTDKHIKNKNENIQTNNVSHNRQTSIESKQNYQEKRKLSLNKNDKFDAKDQKSQEPKKQRRLTQSKTLPLENDQEIEEFYTQNKNQAKDNYMTFKSDKNINNIYKLPSKSHRLSELDCLSPGKALTYDSIHHVFSNHNIEFIKGGSCNQAATLSDMKTDMNIQSPTRRIQTRQLQNISEFSQFDEESFINQQYNQFIQSQQSKKYSGNYQESQRSYEKINFNTDFNNDSCERINITNCNQIGSPTSEYSMMYGMFSGSKIIPARNVLKTELNNQYSNKRFQQISENSSKRENKTRTHNTQKQTQNYSNSQIQQNQLAQQQNTQIINSDKSKANSGQNKYIERYDQVQNKYNAFFSNIDSQEDIILPIQYNEVKINTKGQKKMSNYGINKVQSQTHMHKPLSPRNRDQMSERLSFRERSISNKINSEINDQASYNNNILEIKTVNEDAVKSVKTFSSTFQEGVSNQQMINNLKDNFNRINDFTSNQSTKSGENNKHEENTNSKEGQNQSHLLNSKQQYFPPFSSNLINSNVKSESTYTAYIRSALQGKKILIVDDTMFNVIALKALLTNISQNQITIDEAYNGRQAMQKVLQYEQLYDLILMDVNMPVMDGLQATENIKQINRLNKIIIVTAFSDETDRTECQNRGADGFLTKPVKIKDLATQIQNVFKLYSQEHKQANQNKNKNNDVKENLTQSRKLTRKSLDKSKID